MKTDFDTLLVRSRQRPLPALPGSFSDDVLRTIRQRSAAGNRPRHWGADFLETILRPALLVTATAAALAVGAVFPLFISPPHLHQTTAALDLAVFSAQTPNLPSGLLNHQR